MTYGSGWALGPVDVEVSVGEWVALIGPNGAGKSTLLKTAVGVVDYEGTVRLGDGKRRPGLDVAWMPQRPRLPEEMTVSDYVLLGRTPHLGYLGREGRSDLDAVEMAIARLDLEELAHRTLATLSGGEAQRAVLARALAQEAPVLLLDEPTNGLDVGHAVEVLEVVDQLRLQEGLTVVSAVHDLTLAGRFAQRLFLLAGGRLQADGTAQEVLTEELLLEHYGSHLRVVHHDDGPTVIPTRKTDD
ncbi:MAG: ABC transporter ATP-binding protein [Acidimicrobiia bacterium]